MVVATNSALIANGGNTTIGFSVRPEQGQWQDTQLDSGQNNEFPFGTARFEIFIKSDGDKTVKKVFDCGNKYVIFFNSAESCWDLKLATEF